MLKETSLIQDPGVYTLGIAWDRSACFRKGARFAPNAIKDSFFGIETYSPYLREDLEEISQCKKIFLFDLGIISPSLDLKSEDNLLSQWKTIESSYQKLIPDSLKNQLGTKYKLLTIGGEHSISYFPIRDYLQVFPDLCLLHLDAHADWRDGYEGFHFSHASIVRRVYDHFGKDHRLLQYGIRSGTKEEFEQMEKIESLFYSKEKLFYFLENLSNKTPLYITCDLDFFDPSELPGTGTPESGGETFHTFISLLKKIKDKNIVGADIVELAPNLDPSGISTVLATKVFREFLLLLVK